MLQYPCAFHSCPGMVPLGIKRWVLKITLVLEEKVVTGAGSSYILMPYIWWGLFLTLQGKALSIVREKKEAAT